MNLDAGIDIGDGEFSILVDIVVLHAFNGRFSIDEDFYEFMDDDDGRVIRINVVAGSPLLNELVVQISAGESKPDYRFAGIKPHWQWLGRHLGSDSVVELALQLIVNQFNIKPIRQFFLTVAHHCPLAALARGPCQKFRQ